MTRILIFANGSLPDLGRARALIHRGDLIIAADGGTKHALALGLAPQFIIGDLDSNEVDLQPLLDAGTRLIRHPADKGATDLELALEHARTLGATEIVVLAAFGARLDQTLGNIDLLAGEEYASLAARLDDGVEEAIFCRTRLAVQGSPGDIVSLIPWRGEVQGIVTDGLKWPLRNETLYPNKTRGLSNELLGQRAHVTIQSGLLLAVHRRQSKGIV